MDSLTALHVINLHIRRTIVVINNGGICEADYERDRITGKVFVCRRRKMKRRRSFINTPDLTKGDVYGQTDRIILVTQKTRLEQMIVRYNTIGQTKFYIEHSGGDFEDYQREHDVYTEAAAKAAEVLSGFGRVQRVDRDLVPTMMSSSAQCIGWQLSGATGLRQTC